MNDCRFLIAAGIVAVSLLSGCKTGSVQATDIVLDRETLEISKGESAVLTASVVPEGAESLAVSWSTSNGDVASVDNDGKVTGVAPGECTVTAYAGPLKASCAVTVSGIPVESVSLSETELEMAVGSKRMLYATVSPADAEDRAVKWESSDEGVVSVDYLGEISAIGVGEASVTASAGGKSAVCKVTVTGIPVESVGLEPVSLEMNVGNTVTLVATVYPQNATDRTISWESTDAGVASVSADGTVTANAIGNAVIKATAGGITAECPVHVTDVLIPQKGDFYYSDGTWSTDLDGTKDVIGIIFWTGDPTANDPTLAKEHPDCTRGLAVAVSGEQKPGWQTGYAQYGKTVGSWVEQNTGFDTPTTSNKDGDKLDFINGYNNTRAYEAFNNAPENSGWKIEALDAIASYAETVAAPESSSGWYFPSAKELSLLCAGESDHIWYHRNTDTKNFINERLALVDGSEQLGGSYYWSSSENTYDNVIILYFGVGYPDLCPKGYESMCIVRPVLAF